MASGCSPPSPPRTRPCSVSRGLGVALGPAVAGVAIQLDGQDHRAVWLVCSVAILASIPFTRRLRDEDESGGS
jgi:hypothetical protein